LKKYFLFIFSILIILSGCSAESQDTHTQPSEEGSSVPSIKINGEIYYSRGNLIEEGEYTISEELELGEVQKEDSPYFEESTKVFTVKEDKETLLVKVEDEYEIFKKKSK